MSDPQARTAMFWEGPDGGAVKCELCPHSCAIPEGSAGFCCIRENRGGKLYTASYGRISAIALDPVEKKPLHMFHPGKKVLSIGGFGCNFRCPFCQNHEISMDGAGLRKAEFMLPEQAAAIALKTVPDGNIGVAYTYNEPLIGYEYVYDCAKLVREAGLCNILVTNGFIQAEPLIKLLPFIDAMNIDLKGYSDSFYGKLKGNLETVKQTIALSHNRCHVEVTTLVIPGENEEHIERLAVWLATLSPEIPLHLSRFFPRHMYSSKEPGTREIMYRLQDAAQKHLKNVYLGNM